MSGIISPSRHLNGKKRSLSLVSDTPAERLAVMKRQFGKLRTPMLHIHSFEEPFYSFDAFASLPAPTLFKGGEVKWAGILCCLVLKK